MKINQLSFITFLSLFIFSQTTLGQLSDNNLQYALDNASHFAICDCSAAPKEGPDELKITLCGADNFTLAAKCAINNCQERIYGQIKSVQKAKGKFSQERAREIANLASVGCSKVSKSRFEKLAKDVINTWAQDDGSLYMETFYKYPDDHVHSPAPIQ